MSQPSVKILVCGLCINVGKSHTEAFRAADSEMGEKQMREHCRIEHGVEIGAAR